MSKKKNVPLRYLLDKMDYLDEFAGNWNMYPSDFVEVFEDCIYWLEDSREKWAKMKGS